MTSMVDICNLALSHLGDSANVASIDPPDGSAQADHCARFLPISLNTLLERHAWGFATVRAALPVLDNPSSTWKFCYAQPSDAVNLLAILSPEASSDTSVSTLNPTVWDYGTSTPSVAWGTVYAPQDFIAETLDDGREVIYTNQEGAVLRYTRLVTDPARFTPLFTEALGWLLASKLAGPVLKGESGRKAALDCVGQSEVWFRKAVDSDSSQRQVKQTASQSVGWLNVR